MMGSLIAWILLLPLGGFLLNSIWYCFLQSSPHRGKAPSWITGSIATLSILGSFVLSILLFSHLTTQPEDMRFLDYVGFKWLSLGALDLDVAFRFDVLSGLFCLVITGVGSLIHLYSIGYMSHDATPGKFFSYLNLFCFAMLVLVLGSSLPLMFLGWEGVGLCSYLLIGYWYTDAEKASAGKKAFVVNRIGDFGFLLGMFIIFYTFHSLNFADLAKMHFAESATLTAICLFLFLGCTGKSAQIPLYIWLPDAMAGPTPVSALIHAATMVTSGIYLVSRLNFMFSHSHTALSVVAVVGAVTAFFAATIAVVQTDIKKVLAYSTVSQLGYMFLACGVGAYFAGVFHVVTHAFFKALLFLGAGSVIHGMHEEQDIMKMGGLKKYMPWTFMTFAIGWLAICGIPPFSGFFSKDEILWYAMSSPHGSPLLWALGAITAVMTAFYMTRLFVLTFLGKPRFSEKSLQKLSNVAHHPHAHNHSNGHDDHPHEKSGVHESPWVMLLPLCVLALLSFAGGFMGIPHMSWLEHWLAPVIPAHHDAAPAVAPQMEWILMAISVLGALGGIGAAWMFYGDIPKVKAIKSKMQKIHSVLFNKWYVDELFEATVVKPIYKLSMFFWKGFDVLVIDKTVLGVGRMSEWTGQTMRVLQNGSVQFYALALLFGLVSMAGYLIYGYF
jgi:NADH-quinone oxidoreductase subunit L